MKIEFFDGYVRTLGYRMGVKDAQNAVNEFIKDKKVIDIKVASSRCDYNCPMFQYIVIYEEENE